MKSPWTKKNPWLNMYLSGANAVAGSLRGRAASAAKRQVATAINSGIRQMAGVWTGALVSPSARKKRTKGR